MSLFSVAVLPDGQCYQFKTGFDRFTDYHYELGAEVPYVEANERGETEFADQVTEGSLEEGSRKSPEDRNYVWIVIKNHRIAAVIPFEASIVQHPDFSIGFPELSPGAPEQARLIGSWFSVPFSEDV